MGIDVDPMQCQLNFSSTCTGTGDKRRVVTMTQAQVRPVNRPSALLVPGYTAPLRTANSSSSERIMLFGPITTAVIVLFSRSVQLTFRRHGNALILCFPVCHYLSPPPPLFFYHRQSAGGSCGQRGSCLRMHSFVWGRLITSQNPTILFLQPQKQSVDHTNVFACENIR